MNDKVFIDTNIWIYLYSNDKKSQFAKKLIEENYEKIVISTQVLNEFFNVVAIKHEIKTKEGTRLIIQDIISNFLISVVTVDIILKAIDISIKYQYNYFDSLMLATALGEQCCKFFTEDMQGGQIINDSLTIINPFRS